MVNTKKNPTLYHKKPPRSGAKCTKKPPAKTYQKPPRNVPVFGTFRGGLWYILGGLWYPRQNFF